MRSIFLQGLLLSNIEDLNREFLKIKSQIILLNDFASFLKVSVACICLNFVFLNDFIDKIIIGVDGKNHLKEAIANLRHLSTIKGIYSDLLNLKCDDEKIILPSKWSKKEKENKECQF